MRAFDQSAIAAAKAVFDLSPSASFAFGAQDDDMKSADVNPARRASITDRRGQSNPRSRKDGGKGRECLHLAIHDHARSAYCGIFADQTQKSCLSF